MKKRFTLIALVLCAAMLCACTGDENPGTSGSTGPTVTTPSQTDPIVTLSPQADYAVTVVDAYGNPVTQGVIVNFNMGDKIIAMQPVDGNGIAVKNLNRNDYHVTLSFTDTSVNYHYDTEGLLLTKENTSVTVVLAQALSTDGRMLNAYSPKLDEYKDFPAFGIHTGCTFVSLDSTDRNYLLFIPTEPGLYEFSILNSKATIGYYGGQHFVQSDNLAEMTEEGTFTMSVSSTMIGTEETGTTVLVLGVEANGEDNCIVSIERIGDPIIPIGELPWDIYASTATLNPFALPQGTKLLNFDLTATEIASLVYNEQDGLYHVGTADGPVVYVRLGSSSQYLDPIKTVLASSGIRVYFFDEEGNFQKKEDYTECLMQYIDYMDPVAGVYPLTDDLMFIFKTYGNYVGWWDPEHGNYLFEDTNGNPIPGINHDNAWLFLCCYGEFEEPTPPPTPPTPPTPPVGGEEPTPAVGTPNNPGEPVAIGGVLEFDAAVKAGEYVYYDLYRVSGANLVIEGKYAYVIHNGTVIYAENGVITLELVAPDNWTPVSLAIGNYDFNDATFKASIVFPAGSQTNPIALSLGTFTTEVEENNDVGVYYTFIADKTGTLTITVNSVSGNLPCNIMLYNLVSYQQVNMTETAGATSVSIAVNAGDEIQIVVNMVPDQFYKYPAGTVVATASIQ